MTTNKISIYLNAKGWSEKRFAEEVGISPQQINRYVRDINKPGRVVWKRIQMALPDFDKIVGQPALSNIDVKILAYEEAIKVKDSLIEAQRETIEMLRTTTRSLKEQIADLERKLTNQ